MGEHLARSTHSVGLRRALDYSRVRAAHAMTVFAAAEAATLEVASDLTSGDAPNSERLEKIQWLLGCLVRRLDVARRFTSPNSKNWLTGTRDASGTPRSSALTATGATP